jgi:putative drug exporter of the RND superfamily
VAVGILCASFLPPILVLIVVSLATGLGYVSIYLTGLLLGSVDFEVTYTLMAVILGVSTDYFVFIISRYREELRSGKTNLDALSVATKKAGFAVIVSGLTVAASLGAISFVSGLESWGPVLFGSILLTVALETTLVPAVTSMIGPRLFSRRSIAEKSRGLHAVSGTSNQRSVFYRAAKLSERRKYVVVAVILLLAAPAAFFWFNVPTTYNFNEGLPQGVSSVQALNTVDQKFGSNVIYPTFVVVSFTQSATMSNGSLTPTATASLEADARILLATNGIKQVVGPTIKGTSVGPTAFDSEFLFNNGSNAYFLVFTKDDPYSSGAISIVNHLRENTQFLVGGLTSSVIDLQKYYNLAFEELELLILFVIAMIVGVSFRTPKYPFISLTGVFISITWTTALLYLVSRYVLGQQLVFLIPIIVYVILMSLGNDFAVFILSRVREEQNKFGFEEGLAKAMVGSGSVVTALGLILAVSLGSLGLVPFGFLEQLGIAFVISLIVDTFVIRLFYFPSMLLILKDRKSVD